MHVKLPWLNNALKERIYTIVSRISQAYQQTPVLNLVNDHLAKPAAQHLSHMDADTIETTHHVALGAIALIAAWHIGLGQTTLFSLAGLTIRVVPLKPLVCQFAAVKMTADKLKPGDTFFFLDKDTLAEAIVYEVDSNRGLLKGVLRDGTKHYFPTSERNGIPTPFFKLPAWAQKIQALDAHAKPPIINFNSSKDLILTLTTLAIGILFKRQLASQVTLMLAAQHVVHIHVSDLADTIYRDITSTFNAEAGLPQPLPPTYHIPPCLDTQGKDVLTPDLREFLHKNFSEIQQVFKSDEWEIAHINLNRHHERRTWINTHLASLDPLSLSLLQFEKTQLRSFPFALQHLPSEKGLALTELYKVTLNILWESKERILVTSLPTSTPNPSWHLLHCCMLAWNAGGANPDRVAQKIHTQNLLGSLTWKDEWRDLEGNRTQRIPKNYLDQMEAMFEAVGAIKGDSEV